MMMAARISTYYVLYTVMSTEECTVKYNQVTPEERRYKYVHTVLEL